MIVNRKNGCLILIGLFFVIFFLAIVSIIGVAYFYPEKVNKDLYIPKSKPIDPNNLMNPISSIVPTKYQIESNGFKSIQLITTGGSNQERLLEIRDSNDYCYFINEYDNYIYPLIVDSKHNTFWRGNYNHINDPKRPVIHYLKVAIKEPVFKFTRPNSIETQRKWLKIRTEQDVFGHKTFKDPLLEGSCSNSPRVNIIAIEYSIDQIVYRYHVDSKHESILSEKLEYIFK